MSKIFAVSSVVIRELIRRKDFYVLFILTALITLLLGSVSIFNDENIARYLKEVCLLLIWISLLVVAITTAARQIPAERESRTIFPLLAKPITRTQVLVGKFVGCWLAVGLALLLFYAFFAVISVSREHTFALASYVQALWFHWVLLGIVIALALLGSLVLTPAANVTILFIGVSGILLVAEHLNVVAARAGGLVGWIAYGAYYAMPHLEFFDVRDRVVHDWPAMAWPDVGLATLYGAAYGALFLTAGAMVFRRKPLN